MGIVECGVCIFRKRRKSIAPATQNDFWHATKHVWKSRRAMPATQNNITTYFLIDTARPQRLETRHVGASKRAFRARHPPILILCSFKNRCFPTSFLIDLIIQKCYNCHAKRRSMSPSATPATQSAAAPRATNGAEARHQSQPNVIRATPATQNEGGCEQVPQLPRKAKVDVAKCRACHAKCRGAAGE